MIARRTTDPRPVLQDGAVYWADNGRRICARCAGASALYTGRDLSGQPVERVTIDDVHAWPDDLGPLACEAGCTTLSALAGAGGWPLPKGDPVKIDETTPIWVVTDPTPVSTLPDICLETTLDGLRLQFAGGLDLERRPTLFTTQEEAHEEAKNRLLFWRVARQIRIDRRLPEGEVVRVTLHDRDGRVLFEGEVG